MTGAVILNRTIPTYELYGELLAGTYTDPVHHETIRERSSRHGWTIRLHRHTSLAQIFLFRSSGVRVSLGDLEHISTEPLILVVPPGIPHGFQFPEDVIGDVLSLRVGELDADITERFGQLASFAGGLMARSSAIHFDRIEALIDQLGETYHSVGVERAALLAAITQLIVIYLSADLQQLRRLGSIDASDQLTRHEAQAEKFCGLVDGNFDKPWTVADYADGIGASAPHLTRVCKSILGSSPNELVRQRRLLEAKRLLEYTRLPISEIAHKSGFRDPAYFSRTFKSCVGLTPQDYRSEKNA